MHPGLIGPRPQFYRRVFRRVVLRLSSCSGIGHTDTLHTTTIHCSTFHSTRDGTHSHGLTANVERKDNVSEKLPSLFSLDWMARPRLAPMLGGHKRKVVDDSDPDDCITVAPKSTQPSQAAISSTPHQTRLPLAQANADQAHNKRRRIVDHVLIPKPERGLFDSIAWPEKDVKSSTMSQARLKQPVSLFGSHARQEEYTEGTIALEPRLKQQSALVSRKAQKQSTILGFVKPASKRAELNGQPTIHCNRAGAARPGATTSTSSAVSDKRTEAKRPRRSTTRFTYAADTPMDDMSEVELATSELSMGRRSSARMRAGEDSSDYEEDVNPSAAESVEEDGADFDDGSSVASEEASEAEDIPVRKRSQTSRSSTAPAKKAGTTSNTTVKASDEDMRKLQYLRKAEQRCLATHLPPLHEIDDIFRDMTKKALSLGFDKALKRLKSRPLRIATMCSGTESPLLAMQMVHDALNDLGLDTIKIQHIFSAEIVPYKQAYIERNFAPPIIFRDITEFPEAFESETPVATTAYGSEVAVPTGVDIVIAGTSCVDYSRLNNKKKDIDEGGESGATWEGALAYCKACRPAIIIFENVIGAAWGRMLEHYREIGYDCKGAYVDTKDYYIPHTRQRGYMVCFDTSRGQGSNMSGFGTKWQDLMEKFRRHASSPVSSFLLPNDQVTIRQQSRDDDATREVDWSQCEITQMQYRQNKKIGNARPFTHWQESGTMVVPENGATSWYHKQVERVKDTIDCDILRKSLPNAGMYDARYKTRVWDLSQNVYRDQDNSPFGIIGCITPSGMPFISDAGRAMTAEECLKLQGIPLDKISFTTETPTELRDLAGNAMTSTVIGSALLAALIAGQGLLETEVESADKDMHVSRPASLLSSGVTETYAYTSDYQKLNVADMLRDADRSARKCYCEGSHALCKKPLQQCTDCGHTTCTSCGGSPLHNYRQKLVMSKDRLSPSSFEQYLSSHMPLRLTFGGIEDFGTAMIDFQEYSSSGYVKAVAKAASSVFSFQKIRRTHCWTVSYIAQAARLDLVLEGKHAEWRLYAVPEETLAVNDRLRSSLEQPVAKAVVTKTLFDIEWLWRVPRRDQPAITLTPSDARVSTWWARNEIPSLEKHTQPESFQVVVDDAEASPLELSISGTYRYLPKCGKACDSMYRKVEEGEEGERPVFMFLDPARTGLPEQDYFVFTHDKALLEYGEVRPVIARVKAPWRPWSKKSEQTKNATADVVIDGAWVAAPFEVSLRPLATTLEMCHAKESPVMSSSNDCQSAHHLLSCTAEFCDPDGIGTEQRATNLVNDTRFLEDNTWVFQAMRRQLSNDEWQAVPVEHTLTDCECETCAPAKPQLRWKLGSDRKTLKPYEDPETAASYERAIKSRPDPLVVKLVPQGRGLSAFQIGVNIASLAHRAVARLPPGAQKHRVEWMFDTTNAKDSPPSFSEFKLKATKGVEPYDVDLGMSVSLFPQQRLCLAWMRSQEAGEGKEFFIEEAEEATLRVLGWRVEVRASAPIHIRGGICADHPGFGKTITSLALVQAQLLEQSPAEIRKELATRQSGASKGLIASAATVVICPATLMNQWASEIVDKLRSNKGLLTINRTVDLSRHTIADFESARIILVNRSIFGSESYAERLAAFAAMPGPATATGRSLAQWLQFAKDQVPEHLAIMKRSGIPHLRDHVKTKYQELVRSEKFQAAVPSRRLHGKDYVNSKNSTQAKSQSAKKQSMAVDVKEIDRPLFEMFFFNRMIVDEFHHYEPKEYAAITLLQADKRWGLSGTPAMGDFYDIARMAELLGVPLRIGSDAKGVMKASNIAKIRKEMTSFELFDAMRYVPSNAMHSRIHEIDRTFLDTTVRRNIMDFAEMKWEDILVPISLDLDHLVMYHELSQLMNSLDMRLKRSKKSKNTDREERMHDAIEGSKTAEDALSRTATYHMRNIEAFANSGAGLKAAILIREQESRDLLCKLSGAIINAKKHEPEAFDSWIKTRIEGRTLGDEGVIGDVRRMIDLAPGKNVTKAKAQILDTSRSFSDDDDVEMGEGSIKSMGKNAMISIVNGLCNRLVVSKRSLRFLQNVHKIWQSAQKDARSTLLCEHPHCHSSTSGDVAASGLCGHALCKDCHSHLQEQHQHTCPVKGCSSSMHDYHLLWKSRMGDLRATSHAPYGAKIERAMDFLEEIQQKNEQAILFVQYKQQLDEVEQALADRGIPATVVGSKKTRHMNAGDQIQDFRDSSKNTVIVLNASDETAAGSNLQNANHVIFLSPLLRNTQYEYESTMAQAIGRVRRHGQKNKIFVYRIVALGTIDVDILEHRERRLGALTEQGAPDIVPPPLARKLDMNDEPKPERTQLVRENGRFSLRPQSWIVRYGADLDPDEVEKVKGKNRVMGWQDFSSLVKFSRAYTEDDD